MAFLNHDLTKRCRKDNIRLRNDIIQDIEKTLQKKRSSGVAFQDEFDLENSIKSHINTIEKGGVASMKKHQVCQIFSDIIDNVVSEAKSIVQSSFGISDKNYKNENFMPVIKIKRKT